MRNIKKSEDKKEAARDPFSWLRKNTLKKNSATPPPSEEEKTSNSVRSSDDIGPKQNRTSNEEASVPSSYSDDIGAKQNRASNEAASVVPSSDSDDIVTNSDEVTHIEQKQTKKHEKLKIGNIIRGRRGWVGEELLGLSLKSA